MTVGEVKKEQRWSYLGDENVFFWGLFRVFLGRFDSGG